MRGRQAKETARLRPIGMPRGLQVRVDADGMPLAVARTDARGRRGVVASVETIEDVWRVAEAWWREAPQARTYYRVILEGGRPLTLFHDDTTRTWADPHPGIRAGPSVCTISVSASVVRICVR